MSLNIDALRTQLAKHLGVQDDTTNWPETELDLLLNRTYWELQDKFKFKKKEARTTVSVAQGSPSFSLSPSTLESIRSISLVHPETQEHIPLERWNAKTFESNTIQSTNNEGQPTNYYRENGTVYLYPIPNDTYDILVLYDQTLADLDDTNASPEMPQSWHEIILYGATYRGFALLNAFDQMREFRILYNDHILTSVPVETKEEVDSRFAGLYVHGYDGEL